MADNRPPRRAARRNVVVLWLQVLDDLERIERAIRSAPRGAFGSDEERRAILALDRAWDDLANERPKLPPSGRRRKAVPRG